MDVNEALLIDRIRQIGQPAGGRRAAGAAGEFERLLDAAEPAAADAVPGATEAAEFSDAMRQADADFVALMDFRRQLEAAYRDQVR